MKIRIGGKVRNVFPVYVGTGVEAKVIASIGVSYPEDKLEVELQKARLAELNGASVVIDHSLVRNALEIQGGIAQEVTIPLSVIPVYNAATLVKFGKKRYFTAEDALRIIEDQAQIGADMVTIHASALMEDVVRIKRSRRIIPCTSRGGTMVLENMLASGRENIYWEHFDEILAIAREYRLAISLGAIYRPASVADFVTRDTLFWKEIERNAILVKKATRIGVPIMVEGLGHSSIDRIPEIVKRSKAICHDAPYRVLSVATDSALGFDHVSSAIASAVAVASGADVITAVTRSEHIGLPTVDDVVEAVISAKIAAHCGDLARLGNFEKDIAMSKARNRVGCKGLVQASICPAMTRKVLLQQRKALDGKKCTMCGEFCALSAVDRINKYEEKGRKRTGGN